MPNRPPSDTSRPRRAGAGTALLATMALTTLAACNDDGRTLRPPAPDQDQSISTTTSPAPASSVAGPAASVIVPDQTLVTMATETLVNDLAPLTLVAPWRDGGPIDARFTCDGDDTSPALSWFGVPVDAAELAIAVTDDDAGGFVHWVVAGLAPIDGAVPDGGLPETLVEATNDFATVGWSGPCPPPGAGPHTYRFTVFALNPGIELPDGTPAVDMLTAIRAASVASAVVTGTYER